MDRKIMLWLQEELPKWVQNGWLSTEGMDQIRASYGNIKKEKSPSLSRILILLLGLVLVGLGALLLFAGYWYSFSPNGRIDWIILLVFLNMVMIGIARWKGPQGSICREGAGLLFYVSMLLSTYLVWDTYFLGLNQGIFLFLTTLCALPAAYFLESSFLMGVYMLSAAYWSSTEHANTFYGGGYWVWLLIGLAIPFYRSILKTDVQWNQQKIFMSWALVISVYMASFFTLANEVGSFTIIVLTNLAVITYSLGRLAKTSGFWTLPFRSIGILGLLYIVYMGTFQTTWMQIQGMSQIRMMDTIMAVITLVIALYLVVMIFKKKYYLSTLVGILPIVVVLLAFMAKIGANPLLLTVLFNLFVLFVAVVYILRGTALQIVSLVNSGILAIIIMILARFFDPSFTFLERGISFLLVGGILLVANGLYMWKKARVNRLYNEHVRQSTRNNNRRKLRTEIGKTAELNRKQQGLQGQQGEQSTLTEGQPISSGIAREGEVRDSSIGSRDTTKPASRWRHEEAIKEHGESIYKEEKGDDGDA